ncbi:MAG: 3-phosphoshikimate 1-carboxyvinyltransferase [Candidatus Altimarinota bacterium]
MLKSILVPRLDLYGRTFDIVVPSSKSLANRALILAALSRGEFELRGDFEAEDIQIMMGALREIGVGVGTIETIRTIGTIGIRNDLSWMNDGRDLELFLGNSGTSIRFLTSLVLFRKGKTILTGKERMKERPIRDLVDALRQIGAEIEYLDQEGFPPLRVSGLTDLTGRVIKIRGDVSSQFLTSLLLVGSAFRENVEVLIDGPLISQPYVEMTLDLLRKWDVTLQRGAEGFRTMPQQLMGADMVIEGDASAATYWWALEYLHQCVINVKNVQNDSKQGDVQFKKVLNMLSNCTGEFEIDMNDMPDAAMTLMAVAPFHVASVTIRNIGSLRVKETDRIEAMANELRKCGVVVETGEDWVRVMGVGRLGNRGRLGDGGVVQIETYDDHRIAMSMAVFGTMVGGLEILESDCVGKTYPHFWDDLFRIQAESEV